MKVETPVQKFGRQVNPTEDQILNEIYELGLVEYLSQLFLHYQKKKKPNSFDHEDARQELLMWFWKYNKGKFTELYKNKDRFLGNLVKMFKWKVYNPSKIYQQYTDEAIETLPLLDVPEELNYLTEENNQLNQSIMNYQDAARLTKLSHSLYNFIVFKHDIPQQDRMELEWAHNYYFGSKQLSWTCYNCIKDASEAVFLKFKREMKEAMNFFSNEELALLHEIITIEKLHNIIPQPVINDSLNLTAKKEKKEKKEVKEKNEYDFSTFEDFEAKEQKPKTKTNGRKKASKKSDENTEN